MPWHALPPKKSAWNGRNGRLLYIYTVTETLVCPTTNIRPPLTFAQIRALFDADPTDAARAYCWEIARLHAHLLAAFRVYEYCQEMWQEAVRNGEQMKVMPGSLLLMEHKSALLREPCVQARLDEQWKDRDKPFTRYYPVRDLDQRPDRV